MNKQQIGASPEPTVTLENIHSEDRLSKLRQFYFNSFTNLQDAAFEKFPDLLAFDAHDAMTAVAGLLNSYGGPPDAESFERWAKRKIVEESFRFVCLRLALGEYKLMILKVITDSMWTTAQDCSVQPEDLYTDVLLLIFNRAPMFLKNKRAKLSTRICALAKTHVRNYYNSYNRKRLAAVTKHLENDGVFEGAETLSAIEIASMRKDRAVSDLGYAETGLHLA